MRGALEGLDLETVGSAMVVKPDPERTAFAALDEDKDRRVARGEWLTAAKALGLPEASARFAWEHVVPQPVHLKFTT